MDEVDHMSDSFRIIKEQGEEITRLRIENELRRRQISRFPFCPDHRDKVLGKPCRECEIEQQRADNDRLTKLIEDHMTHQENAVRAAMDETCDLYEQHCTCVPVLRAENEKLLALLATCRKYVTRFSDVDYNSTETCSKAEQVLSDIRALLESE